MKIKATTYLNSGVKLSYFFYDKTMKAIEKSYLKIFPNKKAILTANGSVIKIILSNDTSEIELLEVAE